jgi:hypothetical protein
MRAQSAGDAAFHLGDARFQHGRRRVHDAGIDVAGHLQVEQVGAVLGIVEGIGRGLVDRHRRRLGGRVGGVAVMQRDRFQFHVPLRGCRRSSADGHLEEPSDFGMMAT